MMYICDAITYEELDFTILNSYDFVYNHLQGVVFESHAPIYVSLYNCSCCVKLATQRFYVLHHQECILLIVYTNIALGGQLCNIAQ